MNKFYERWNDQEQEPIKQNNMKTKLKIFGSLSLLCLLTFSARAAVLVQDNFDSYTAGAALPTNNAVISPWIGISGTPAVFPTNGIQVVSDPTGNSANALQIAQFLTQDIQ